MIEVTVRRKAVKLIKTVQRQISGHLHIFESHTLGQTEFFGRPILAPGLMFVAKSMHG